MFGNNTPRRRHRGDELQLAECFLTIQGEGPFSGRSAVFVRLTGCNLRCHFCDTKWNDEADPTITSKDLASMVMAESGGLTKLCVLTGGEPTRQDLHHLITDLHTLGFHVQVETAGTFWQDCLAWTSKVTVVVSPKTSKVHKNFRALSNVVWKYPIRAGEVGDDGLPVGNLQRGKDGKTLFGGDPARPPAGATVYLQPIDDYDEAQNMMNLKAVQESAIQHGHIAGVQLHKLMGLP